MGQRRRDRKERERENKQESTNAFQDFWLTRQENRINRRNTHDMYKYGYYNNSVANGIDPRAAHWEGISSLGSSLTSGLSSIFGGSLGSLLGGGEGGSASPSLGGLPQYPPTTQPFNMNIILIVIGGFVFLKMLKIF